MKTRVRLWDPVSPVYIFAFLHYLAMLGWEEYRMNALASARVGIEISCLGYDPGHDEYSDVGAGPAGNDPGCISVPLSVSAHEASHRM